MRALGNGPWWLWGIAVTGMIFWSLHTLAHDPTAGMAGQPFPPQRAPAGNGSPAFTLMAMQFKAQALGEAVASSDLQRVGSSVRSFGPLVEELLARSKELDRETLLELRGLADQLLQSGRALGMAADAKDLELVRRRVPEVETLLRSIEQCYRELPRE